MYCDLKINRKIKTAVAVSVLIVVVFVLAVSVVYAASAGWVTGKFSKAYDFNGRNYIDVGNVYNGVKTVSFWVKGTGAGQVLNLSDTVYVSINSNTVTATGFTSPTIYIDGVVGSTVDSNWHFVAVTDTSGINASAVKFGSLTPSYLTGVMDDVKMFNYALSAREINEKYRQGAPSLAQGGTASGDLYIMNSGKLGIGTTTASSLLTVVGDSYFTGNIGIGTSTPYTKLDVWGSFQVGTSTTPTLTPLFIANTGTATVGIGTSTPASKFAIVGTAGVNSLNVASSTGSSMLMVDQYGNLGIGTSSPVAKFAVEGNTFLRGNATTTGDLFVGGSATTTNLYVSNILTAGYLNILGTTTLAANLVPATTNTYNVGTANYRWNEGWFNTLNIGTSTWSINQPDNQRLSFWNSASGTGVEKLTITQAGWLGISTSSPSALLAITGTSSVASLQISSSTGAMDFMVGQYGNVGIGTSTPSARLDMLSRAGWSSLHIASSTGANMLSINEYGLVSFGLPDNQSTAMTVSEGSNTYLTFDTTDGVEKIVVGKNLEIGPMNVDADSGAVNFVNMDISTTTATSTAESLSVALDGTSILTIYGEADGQGGLINQRVGIGTTTPIAVLSVRGNASTSGALLRVSTSTTEALSIDALGYVGLGTTSPTARLAIAGVAGINALQIASTTGASMFMVGQYGNVGIGTSSPSAKLDILATNGWPVLHIASSSGANMMSIDGNGLFSFGLPDNQSTAMTVSEGSNTYLTFDTTDGVEKIVVGKNLEIGPMNVDADSGEVDFVNMTVSTTTATSTIESLSIAIDDNSILTIYGEADGQGNLINYRVGIGTTSPTAMLDIRGNVSTSGALLRVSTSTTEALSIDALGYVGLGTTSPATKLDIYGVGTQLRISTTSGYANFYVDNNGYLNMETQYSTTSALQITNSDIVVNQPLILNSPGDFGLSYDLSMENPSAAYIRFSGAGYVQTESPFGNNNLTLSAANAGQVVINDNMQITGQTQFVATTTQTVSTTTAIVVGDATYITVTATSSVILSSAPTIADGVNGQVVILKGASTTATVSLQDQGTLGNSNLQLGATPRQLGNGDTLALMFDGTDWVELWFSADINADYAEMYKIKEDVGFGEVVSLDKDNYLQVKKAVLGEKDVAGIISAQPAYLIGQEFRDEMQLPVALAGRVPVKISLEAGEIKKGDILVPSTKPGYAMRYNEEYLKQVSASSSLDLSNVPIVGISLENYGAPSAAGEFLETTYKTYKVKFKEGSDSADINLLNGKYKVKVLPSPNSPSRNIDISTSPQEQTIEIRAGYADKYLQASVMESSQWLSDNIIRQPNPEFRPANSNNETALCMVRSGYVRVGPSSGFSKLTVIEKDGQLSFEPEDKNFAEALDMVIEADGSLVVGKLKAKQAEIGSTEKPAGITLYDEETGAPYCLKIKAGAMISEAGKCGENGKEGGSLLPAGRSEPPSDDTPVVSEPPAASTDSLLTPSVDSATTTPVIPSEPQASEESQPPAPETPPAEQPAD